DKFDVDEHPDLRSGLALLGGEPRARHLYARRGAAADLLAAWREALGDRAWVMSRDEAIKEGWFGSVDEAMASRIGDVVAAPPGPAGRHPLPDPAAFQAAMRAAGVSQGRPVVVYDDGDAMSAARGWWTLRYFGHPDVRVLDGGYRAWTGAGLPVSTDEPAPAPGDFTAEPGQMPVLDAAGAQAMARTGLLLDARAGARSRRATEPAAPVGGHPPGAVRG